MFSGGDNLGSDTITEDSSEGTDTLDFSRMSAGVSIDLSNISAQTLNASLTVTLSSATGIENLIGTPLNDSLTGNTLDNVLEGGAGNDRLTGQHGQRHICVCRRRAH